MTLIIGNNSATMRAYNQARRIHLRLGRHNLSNAEVERMQVAMMRLNAQCDMLAVKAALLAKGYNHPYRLGIIA